MPTNAIIMYIFSYSVIFTVQLIYIILIVVNSLTYTHDDSYMGPVSRRVAITNRAIDINRGSMGTRALKENLRLITDLCETGP